MEVRLQQDQEGNTGTELGTEHTNIINRMFMKGYKVSPVNHTTALAQPDMKMSNSKTIDQSSDKLTVKGTIQTAHR